MDFPNFILCYNALQNILSRPAFSQLNLSSIAYGSRGACWNIGFNDKVLSMVVFFQVVIANRRIFISDDRRKNISVVIMLK